MSTDIHRSLPGRAARWLGLLAVAGLAGLLVYGVVAQAPDRAIDDALSRAEAVEAPGFELEILQRGRVPSVLAATFARASADGRLALSELRGTPVVLNFWASWCEPCRVEAPILERAWRQSGKQGVLFLGLDMQDAREDAREFLRTFSITYPNIHEAGKEIARDYGATGLPETFFISARGSVVAHVIGALTPAQLRDGIAAARSGRPLPASRGGARQSTN